MFTYVVKLAASQILRYSLQSLLAVTGMAIAVANIIMLISITDLGRSQTMGFINELGANVIVIMPFVESESGAMAHMMSSFSGRHLPLSYSDAVLATEEIEATAPVLSLPAHAGFGAKRAYTTVLGVTEPFLEIRGHSVVEGTWLTETDVATAARNVLLGQTIATDLFGDEMPVGQRIVIKGQQFQVIGLMMTKGHIGMEDIDNITLIPLSTAQEIFGIEGFHGMFARHKPGIEPDQAARACRAALAALVPEDQDIDELVSVLTIKEATSLMDSTLGIFRAVLAGIASIALIVGGIGIMNVMMIRVLQRRAEIGIRLAAGATPRDLQLQFMTESALLAVIGTAAGVLLGICGVIIYCRFAQWQPAVNSITVSAAALYCICASLLFGIAPAIRASRTDPVESLRSEF